MDQEIASMTRAMEGICNNDANKEKLYIMDGPISSLPIFAGDTLFAMRAPQGTTMEVLEPDNKQFM